MKAKDVKLNSVYAVQISGKIAPVKLAHEVVRKMYVGPHSMFGKSHSYGGGWIGLNLATKRETRIKTAAKLRYELHQCECGAWCAMEAYVCVKCSKRSQVAQA